jgi:hypothetical protein
MKKCRKKIVGKALKTSVLCALLLTGAMTASAQDGNAGIQQANTQVRSYFESGTNLMYAIGALVGLIGPSKFTRNGTPETRIPPKLPLPGSAPASSLWSWPPSSNHSSASKSGSHENTIDQTAPRLPAA